MCGRTCLPYSRDEFFQHISLPDNPAVAYRPSYNIAPTHSQPILTADGLVNKRWGIHSHHFIINLRAETLSKKYSPCVVFCQGYYEWNKESPWYIRSSEPLLYVAGVFIKDEYCIMTTDAMDEIEKVHHRMPITLSKDQIDDWLQHGILKKEWLRPQIKWQLLRVSTFVNKVANNSEKCIKESKQKTLQDYFQQLKKIKTEK